ncbi:MAG: sugar phosphate isomerase/epimerase [Anaerolineales bacterium]|nr:sugar phosphate isomerase/epimerase [Anaerolineales bacterium]
MNILAFVTANYVARQVGYDMSTGWGRADEATQAHFRPIETFEARLAELFVEIRGLGFDAVDLWTAHLHWQWATSEHLAAARRQAQTHGLTITGYAGGFGDTLAEFEVACRTAAGLGARVLAGGTTADRVDRAAVIAALKRHDLYLGFENHPEKTPADLLARIGGESEGRLGAAVDTGWWGTQGNDAAAALRALGPQLVAVHLKDVRAAGAHHTCRFGDGVVPLRACVAVLREIGYTGPLTVEHEPEQGDPLPDVAASLALLKTWLGA